MLIRRGGFRGGGDPVGEGMLVSWYCDCEGFGRKGGLRRGAVHTSITGSCPFTPTLR